MKFVMHFRKIKKGELVFEAKSPQEADIIIDNHLFDEREIKWDKPRLDDVDTVIDLCLIKKNGRRIPLYLLNGTQYLSLSADEDDEDDKNLYNEDDEDEDDVDEDDEDYDEDDEDFDEVDLSGDEDELPYINTCKWEDGCGGCPYYDDCALTQTGSWY